MILRDIFLAVFVMLLWGTNFVAIKLSLVSFPPFLQLALRFIFACFPIIFFIKKPNCSKLLIFKFSLLIWIFQLSAIALGLYLGMPAALCSLLMQTQTIFTVLLSSLFFYYKPKKLELMGIMLAFAGVSMIAVYGRGQFTWTTFMLILFAALSVAMGNLLFKGQQQKTNMLSLIIWSCLIPPIPMFFASFVTDGWETICLACLTFKWSSFFAIIYSSFFATIVATTCYTYLLEKYEPATIVPFTMLTPIFGTFASTIILQERLTQECFIAATFIIVGLLINQLSKRTPKQEAFREEKEISLKQAA
jgi:O-acetylserine/cysteine efflux transporter